MNRKDLVTICSVPTSTEAEIIRGVLEATGIACQIGGEGQAGFAGVLQIDICTQAEDAREARKHLKRLKRTVRLRRQRRAEKKRKPPLTEGSSDAIQDLNAGTDLKEKPTSPE